MARELELGGLPPTRRHRRAGAEIESTLAALQALARHERSALRPRRAFGRFAILPAERRLLVDGEPVRSAAAPSTCSPPWWRGATGSCPRKS
jgi:hypothetical protein